MEAKSCQRPLQGPRAPESGSSYSEGSESPIPRPSPAVKGAPTEVRRPPAAAEAPKEVKLQARQPEKEAAAEDAAVVRPRRRSPMRHGPDSRPRRSSTRKRSVSCTRRSQQHRRPRSRSSLPAPRRPSRRSRSPSSRPRRKHRKRPRSRSSRLRSHRGRRSSRMRRRSRTQRRRRSPSRRRPSAPSVRLTEDEGPRPPQSPPPAALVAAWGPMAAPATPAAAMGQVAMAAGQALQAMGASMMCGAEVPRGRLSLFPTAPWRQTRPAVADDW
mmetsp:Transcript_66566/g.142373  ORF Transcript_66566/g.142373 Transcript_66566/m.142373 type:complete len:271 (+) Transcript_66566:192-1004(+)